MDGLEEMWLETSVGRVEAWYLAPLGSERSAPSPLVIIAHGNGDLIDRWLPSTLSLRRMGIGVLFVEIFRDMVVRKVAPPILPSVRPFCSPMTLSSATLKLIRSEFFSLVIRSAGAQSVYLPPNVRHPG